MKRTLYIFSNNSINNFLTSLLPQYHLIFMKLDLINYSKQSTQGNIVFINTYNELELIYSSNLNQNYLIISNLKNKKLKFDNKSKLLNGPISINHIKTTIESFVQNLKIQFHDISIDNEKLTNLNDNSFCYLTKIELEILSYLIKEKETSKNYIKENILNIKSSIETNSLESHLTRIRKKMNKINTDVKIQTRSEKLLIIV